MGPNPTGPSIDRTAVMVAATRTGWAGLIDEAEATVRLARRIASERPPGSADQAAAASLVERLPEFIHDLQIASRRGRTNEAAYRSVLVQLRSPLPGTP